jgi:hypothetical protein
MCAFCHGSAEQRVIYVDCTHQLGAACLCSSRPQQPSRWCAQCSPASLRMSLAASTKLVDSMMTAAAAAANCVDDVVDDWSSHAAYTRACHSSSGTSLSHSHLRRITAFSFWHSTHTLPSGLLKAQGMQVEKPAPSALASFRALHFLCDWSRWLQT